jgi:hypothetical protein
VELRENADRDDWISFSQRLLEKPARRSWFATRAEEGEPAPPVESGPMWNEITFIAPKLPPSTADHPTMHERFADLKGRFPVMREKLARVFEENIPELRTMVENRISFLEHECNRFAALVNPYHIQPGLLLDLDIVTIKRRSSTMMTMANVLNEFLYTVSQGFSDQAFAEFARRRSTQRADLAEEFVRGTGTTETAGAGEEVFE